MKVAASPRIYMGRCPKAVYISSASKKPQRESFDSLCGFLYGNGEENGRRASPVYTRGKVATLKFESRDEWLVTRDW